MNIEESVQTYYGKSLQTKEDLKTQACCSPDSMPDYVKSIAAELHEEVLLKYYGCGLVIPSLLDNLKVLDLGCGAGRDCYLLSKLVGENGSVTGIDMTAEQLEVANRHQEFHTSLYNYQKSNVNFIEGNLERLDELNLVESSFDLIVSNCVLNLTNDKQKILNDSYKLLKKGGEFYFSDIYCSRRVPEQLQQDEILWGECLSGALYWNDFQNMAKAAGFLDPRVVESRELSFENPDIIQKLSGLRFFSVTYRLFKLPQLEPACEDYGQAVCYKGTIEHQADAFLLDDHHLFPTNKVMTVCGNSYDMLNQTRFASHFDFYGDRSTHFGIFQDCGLEIPYESAATNSSSAGCC